jgi:hypothetical protein
LEKKKKKKKKKKKEEGRIAGLCVIMGFSKELYIFHLIDEYWICFSSSFEMSTGFAFIHLLK